MAEGALLDRARAGDDDAFGRLVAPYQGELHAHCYRILGSVHDADDALQDALLGAWKGLSGFEGRSSLRGWLYTVATHAAMRVGSRRPKRQLSLDLAPPLETTHDLGEPIAESAWLQPYPGSLVEGLGALDPAARYDVRESVELAFVSALQHLPATQRAVLILRDVLAFSAAEVATALDTTVPAVNSALQRARASLDSRRGPASQQQTLRDLGDERLEELVEAFVSAWERSDVEALLDLLVEDARLSMPPLPAWFDGREAVGRFLRERMFATPWRLVPSGANGQLAFGCYQGTADGDFRLGGVTLLTLRGDRVADLTSFLAPIVDRRFGLSEEFRPDR
jgi:RNA polymerase sigma-70 factor (TIGR02960 family)